MENVKARSLILLSCSREKRAGGERFDADSRRFCPTIPPQIEASACGSEETRIHPSAWNIALTLGTWSPTAPLSSGCDVYSSMVGRDSAP